MIKKMIDVPAEPTLLSKAIKSGHAYDKAVAAAKKKAKTA